MNSGFICYSAVGSNTFYNRKNKNRLSSSFDNDNSSLERNNYTW